MKSLQLARNRQKFLYWDFFEHGSGSINTGNFLCSWLVLCSSRTIMLHEVTYLYNTLGVYKHFLEGEFLVCLSYAPPWRKGLVSLISIAQVRKNFSSLQPDYNLRLKHYSALQTYVTLRSITYLLSQWVKVSKYFIIHLICQEESKKYFMCLSLFMFTQETTTAVLITNEP